MASEALASYIFRKEFMLPIRVFRRKYRGRLMGKRLEVSNGDVLVYKGFEFDQNVLEAVLSANKRVLWAFVKKGVDVMAVPYDESRCIWLEASDIPELDDIEV